VLVEIENENALLALLEALKNKTGLFAYYACGDKPNRTIPCRAFYQVPVLNSAGYGIRIPGRTIPSELARGRHLSRRDTLKVSPVTGPLKRTGNPSLKAAILLKEKLDRIPP